MRLILMFAAAAALCACAGVKTKTELVNGRHAPVVSRFGPVCLLAGDLPEPYHATPIGRIKATKGTYGNPDNLMKPMADEARRVGADVIVDLQANTRFKGPLPWRVAAPTGDGQAMKLVDDGQAFDCAQAGGQVM
jgi:hypothetical protein